jgi:predicted DsbA family dithiol-disulfide isomerase
MAWTSPTTRDSPGWPRFVFDSGELIVGVTSTEALGDALRQAMGR